MTCYLLRLSRVKIARTLMYNAVNNTIIANPISTWARHVPNAPADAVFAMINSLFID